MTKVRVTAAIMDFTEDAFLKDEKNTLNVKVDTEGKVNEKQNEENPEEKAEKRKQHIKAEIIDWAKTLFLFCALPVIIFECFCFVARVPTGSMETTVPAGAQVLVTRCFNKDNLNRGDVVVFYNEELDLTLFKRCIGLPGDTVEFDGTGTSI